MESRETRGARPHGLVEAARAAGMRALGFAGGLTAAESLRGPGTIVFSDMRELPRLLASAVPPPLRVLRRPDRPAQPAPGARAPARWAR